jgi:hypothetical protein
VPDNASVRGTLGVVKVVTTRIVAELEAAHREVIAVLGADHATTRDLAVALDRARVADAQVLTTLRLAMAAPRTVADLRAQLLRIIDGVRMGMRGEYSDPEFIEAIQALPDTSRLARLAPEVRQVIEYGLSQCSDSKGKS